MGNFPVLRIQRNDTSKTQTPKRIHTPALRPGTLHLRISAQNIALTLFLQKVFARFFISWLRFLFVIAPFSASRTWWQPRPRPGLKVTAENAQGFVVLFMVGRNQSLYVRRRELWEGSAGRLSTDCDQNRTEQTEPNALRRMVAICVDCSWPPDMVFCGLLVMVCCNKIRKVLRVPEWDSTSDCKGIKVGCPSTVVKAFVRCCSQAYHRGTEARRLLIFTSCWMHSARDTHISWFQLPSLKQ